MKKSLSAKNNGPFDVIGDLHGCFDEMMALLEKLGYVTDVSYEADTLAFPLGKWSLAHPEDRIPVFLGDMIDRGPKTPLCLAFVMDVCESGPALCVCGNHDNALLNRLKGKPADFMFGLDETLDELAALPQAFTDRVIAFLDGLASHYVFDEGRLVIAHGGLKEAWHGEYSDRERKFCVDGDATGEFDDFGRPILRDWVSDYHGNALVVYGHVVVKELKFVNNTIDIDTGCVFGGSLTALRYPSEELVSITAAKAYYVPKRVK